jgi:hypothetical protein
MSEYRLGPPSNEVEIPTPEAVHIEEVELAREGRTASGRLVADVLAVKRKFTLRYAALSNGAVAALRAVYAAHLTLNFIYPEAGGTESALVRMAALPREAIAWAHPTHGWRNASVVLEEV